VRVKTLVELLGLDAEVSADVIAALVDDLEEPDAVQVLVVDDFHLTGAGGAQALALHLSLNTVKTRLRHNYMKLGVTSRSAAIKRATSLGLL
jgi:ATP/maltotriose-dependent transcriptional regulator MalT